MEKDVSSIYRKWKKYATISQKMMLSGKNRDNMKNNTLEKRERTQKEEKELHEVNRYTDSAFPVGTYEVTRERILPEGRGYKDLHWHEELQFTYVVKGELQIRIDGKDYIVKEGEVVFINRNLLHITTNLTEDGKYISLNFPDKLLGFFPGSRMEQDYEMSGIPDCGEAYRHVADIYRAYAG